MREESSSYGVYRSKEYTDVINEYFDIDDRETRKVLLAVNEADQNQILTALTSKLYDNIIDKVDDIDFGDIPRTKGDITSLPSYDKLVNCTKVLKDILIQYKQKTDPIDEIITAISNIIGRKELFEKAYRYNVELPIVVYNCAVLAVISSISLMISTTIDFIKMPSSEGFSITLDTVALAKTRDNLLFNNLEKFNKSCKNRSLDTALDAIIKNNMKNLTGVELGVIGGGIAITAIIFNIIPILRELIYFFYYTRTRVSDYFDVQADLLQMNAHNLEINDSIGKEKIDSERIAKKQMKIVELFKRISNALAITCKTAEVATTKEVSTIDKKIKTGDILDEMPDSAASSLF